MVKQKDPKAAYSNKLRSLSAGSQKGRKRAKAVDTQKHGGERVSEAEILKKINFIFFLLKSSKSRGVKKMNFEQLDRLREALMSLRHKKLRKSNYMQTLD